MKYILLIFFALIFSFGAAHYLGSRGFAGGRNIQNVSAEVAVGDGFLHPR